MLNSLLGRLLQQLVQRKPEARAWPEARTEHLRRQVSALAAKDRIRFTFAPSSETDFIRYFPEDLDLDFRDLLAQGFEFVPRSRGLAGVDLAVITAHGSDISSTIWQLREEAGPEMLIAVWLWDNHLLQLNNLRTALAADFVFPSHNYLSAYLINPASVAATHIPACACQWTREEVSRNFASAADRVRSDKLLVNYVDYPFSWRSQLLRKLKAQLAQADVFLMDPDDRSRYFAKTRSERMQEWLGYKSTLILPVANDLSTRVFDALLAGQVLVVSPQISDFDAVFPPQVQAELGMIRLADLQLSTIGEAAKKAIEIFDRAGAAGAKARHEYALTNHMLVHRLGAMLTCIREVSDGTQSIEFGTSREAAIGLHLRRES